MSEFTLQSLELLDFEKVRHFWANIRFVYDTTLQWELQHMFHGYYIYRIPKEIVDHVYFDTFFQSEEYFSAVKRGNFSTKWVEHIKSQLRGDHYIIDARDYNWELLRYFAEHPELKLEIAYLGDLFWVYHDIWHVYLNHLYTRGTFKHKQEMDASLFAVIRLLQEKIFDEDAIMKLVKVAVGPLLKSWKIIDKHDYRYFLIQMNYFKKMLWVA